MRSVLLLLCYSSALVAQERYSLDTVVKGAHYHYEEEMSKNGIWLESIRMDGGIDYPDSAREDGIEGKVVVAFAINEDGSISDLKVVKGLGHGCDEAALRTISNMPPWKPARQGGRPVKVNWVLPVVFKLD